MYLCCISENFSLEEQEQIKPIIDSYSLYCIALVKRQFHKEIVIPNLNLTERASEVYDEKNMLILTTGNVSNDCRYLKLNIDTLSNHRIRDTLYHHINYVCYYIGLNLLFICKKPITNDHQKFGIH